MDRSIQIGDNVRILIEDQELWTQIKEIQDYYIFIGEDSLIYPYQDKFVVRGWELIPHQIEFYPSESDQTPKYDDTMPKNADVLIQTLPYLDRKTFLNACKIRAVRGFCQNICLTRLNKINKTLVDYKPENLDYCDWYEAYLDHGKSSYKSVKANDLAMIKRLISKQRTEEKIDELTDNIMVWSIEAGAWKPEIALYIAENYWKPFWRHSHKLFFNAGYNRDIETLEKLFQLGGDVQQDERTPGDHYVDYGAIAQLLSWEKRDSEVDSLVTEWFKSKNIPLQPSAEWWIRRIGGGKEHLHHKFWSKFYDPYDNPMEYLEKEFGFVISQSTVNEIAMETTRDDSELQENIQTLDYLKKKYNLFPDNSAIEYLTDVMADDPESGYHIRNLRMVDYLNKNSNQQ